MNLILKANCKQQKRKHNYATQIRVGNRNLFYFSIKTYVVGTQKNRLNETVLLSTQNKCLNRWVKNNYNYTLKKIPYLDLCYIQRP